MTDRSVPGSEFGVVRHGHRASPVRDSVLHDHMAAAAPNLDEPVLRENPANVLAGEPS